MSYANGTPFLNLAQTVGTDHRDWFDENEAKLDLDTKMKTLWDERTSTTAILAALQESVASLDTDVTSLSGIVSGHTTTIATINESLVLINTALNALNTQVTNKFDSVGIADPYDAAYGIYSVGDVVTYNGQRYVCNTAVTAAEPFDVSKWTAEDVQTAIDNIQTQSIKYVDVTASGSVPAAGSGALIVAFDTSDLEDFNTCISAILIQDASGASNSIIRPVYSTNSSQWSIFISQLDSVAVTWSNVKIRVFYI